MSLLAVICAVLGTAPAPSSDDPDAPIPYDESGSTELPPSPTSTARPRQSKDAQRSLAHLDDPNVGLGASLQGGVVLFESSRGAGVDPRLMYGARLTWEWGRLLGDEALGEMFFADASWFYGALGDGTAQVSGATHLHSFTLAPAFALRFGQSSVSAFAQLGAGLNYDHSSLRIDQSEVQVSGLKGVLQYGVGVRGRPALTERQGLRLEWRIEVTRFLRGYMHDTYLGAGLGAVF